MVNYMRVMALETTLDSTEIIDEAITYFKDHFGLQISDQVRNCCIEFSNVVGNVTIQVFPKGTKNEVVMTTREWEFQVLEFLKFLQR